MRSRVCIAALAGLLMAQRGYGQATQAVPYNAQLRTDPAVGNVQGIQRYGRSLKTDPSEGEGFSYHVYPVAQPSGSPVSFLGGGAPPGAVGPFPQGLVSFGTGTGPVRPDLLLPFNSTLGLRTPTGIDPQTGLLTLAPNGAIDLKINHQPLIQVKVRVIEVERTDALFYSSILDYVSQNPANDRPTFISGNNINANKKNLSSSTRFSIPGLITLDTTGTKIGTGAGLLVNLTTKHINFLASLLATEFNADIVTAPQVTTLNGQNVEFIAGSKMPFEIGQNVIVDNTTNIQQFFYKHVGTYISVTPQIVNWGPNHENRGRVKPEYARPDSLSVADVRNWNILLVNLRNAVTTRRLPPLSAEYVKVLNDAIEKPEQLLDASLKERIVTTLNGFLGTGHTVVAESGQPVEVIVDRMYLEHELKALNPPERAGSCPPGGCDWTASDCTIDLSIVVRLSGTGSTTVSTPDRSGVVMNRPVTIEDNVRAIANIVQVKSGEGVVMAGLIGERDIESVAKVPILGDIPYVGALFRSKSTDRAKTETLIFVEAQVLDANPATARCQSYRDFRLGERYVSGDFLDNPLEFGMYRAGFGTYLPPHSCEEKVFWERLGRKVRKAATEFDDIFK